VAEKPTYQDLEKKIAALTKKLQEKTEQNSDEKYRALFEKSKDAILIIGNDNFIDCNQATVEMLGYKNKTEFLNTHPSELSPPLQPDGSDSYIKAEEMIKMALQKGSHNFEWDHIRVDKTIIPVEVLLTTISNTGGNYVIHTIWRDITERRKTEKALKMNDIFLQTLIRAIPDLVWLKDEGGQYLFCNSKFERFFGASEQDIIGKTDYDFVDKKLADSFRQHDKLAMNKGAPSINEEEVIYADDGHHELLETIKTPMRDREGELIGVLGIARDISAHKQVESNLRKKDFIIHSSRSVITTTDPDGLITYVNPAFYRKWGFEHPDEVIGKHFSEFWMVNDVQREVIAALNSNMKEWNGELLAKKKDGTYFDVLVSAAAVFDEKGTPVEFMATSVDISWRTLLEKEKHKAELHAAKQNKHAQVGKVAGKIAHDFNNILGIIMGNAELSLLDCKEAETLKTLQLIFEQTLRGKNLTKNLVAFAKDQEPKQEFFKTNEKIDLIIDLLRKDLKNIKIIKEEAPGIPELLADPGMIEHGLINIIQNSIHALSKEESPVITIRTFCRNEYIFFEIEDNGCGIPEEHVDSIFDITFSLKGSRDTRGYYKSDIKGTGYGMANVKKYIEQHNGTISVESESGSGTRVTITIPVTKKELSPYEKDEIRSKITHFNKNVLLVEDELSLSEIQCRLLTQEPCKHKVDIASVGQTAIDLFEKNDYDFVSLDYMLPGEINGMGVYNHIRRANKTIPILFISGNIEFIESIKEMQQKDDYIFHLSKPTQNKDYLNRVNKIMDKCL